MGRLGLGREVTYARSPCKLLMEIGLRQLFWPITAISPAIGSFSFLNTTNLTDFSGLGVEGQGWDCLEVLLNYMSSICEKASQLKSESDSFTSFYVLFIKIWWWGTLKTSVNMIRVTRFIWVWGGVGRSRERKRRWSRKYILQVAVLSLSHLIAVPHLNTCS